MRMMSTINIFLACGLGASLLLNLCSPNFRILICIVLLSLTSSFVITTFHKIFARLIQTLRLCYQIFKSSSDFYEQVKRNVKSEWHRLEHQCSVFQLRLALICRHVKKTVIHIKAAMAVSPGTLERARSLVTPLVEKGRTFVRALGELFKRGFQYFSMWLKYKFSTIIPGHHAPQDGRQPRVVFIVSLPYGKSYSELRKRIEKKESWSPSIDWNSTRPDQIPSLTDLTTSVRHFALCVMDLTTWTDPDKALRDKFIKGAYWDLNGPDPHPLEGDCDVWIADKIEHIDSIYEVGMITYSNSTISDEIYMPLRDAWGSYEVLGWSSWDFAIRLSCLMLNDDITKGTLRQLRERIETIRGAEALEYDIFEMFGQRVLKLFYLYGLVGGISTIILAVVAGLVGSGVALAQPQAMFFCGIWLLRKWLGYDEPRFMKTWRARAKLMEDQFPQLQGLVNWEQSRRE